MGWCEENGKRPHHEGYKFYWASESYLEVDCVHRLPHEIWSHLKHSGHVSVGYPSFSEAIRNADIAAQHELENKVRRQQWISLSHATAAKFSNHVRLATAGRDAC